MIAVFYIALLLSSVDTANSREGLDPASAIHHFLKNDLTSECYFGLGGWMYDLCPLILKSGLHEIEGGEKKIFWDGRGRWRWTQRRYSFSFWGANVDPSCPRGTWICMKETHGTDHYRPDSDTPFTEHVPIAGPSLPGLSSARRNTYLSGNSSHQPETNQRQAPIQLVLNDPSGAEIEFECAADTQSEISFLEEQNGVHRFRWKSRHSCPVSRADNDSAFIVLQESDTLGDQDEIKNGDEDTKSDKETDLTSPPPMIKKSRPWMATMLFIAIFLLLTITTLHISPTTRTTLLTHVSSRSESIVNRDLPALKRHLRLALFYLTIPHPLLRGLRNLSGRVVPRAVRESRYMPSAFRFRTHEGRLVRWAQEDMSSPVGLMDEGGELDLDVMVNGRTASKVGRVGEAEDWDLARGGVGIEMDEFVPLRSAREVEKVRDYGSQGRSARVW